MVSGPKNGAEEDKNAKKLRKLLKDVNDMEHKLNECFNRKVDLEASLKRVEFQIAATNLQIQEKQKLLQEATQRAKEKAAFIPEPHMFVDLNAHPAELQRGVKPASSMAASNTGSPKPTARPVPKPVAVTSKPLSPEILSPLSPSSLKIPFVSLPIEVRLRILAMLPQRDLQSVACTCKQLHFDCLSPRIRNSKLREALLASHSSPATPYQASGFSSLTSAGNRINGINIINSRGILTDDEWMFRLVASAAVPAFLCVQSKEPAKKVEQKEGDNLSMSASDSALLQELDNAISSFSFMPLSPRPADAMQFSPVPIDSSTAMLNMTQPQPIIKVKLTCQEFIVDPPPSQPSTVPSVEWSKVSTVVKVNLFGPRRCGKTALMNVLAGQPFDPVGWPTSAPYSRIIGYKDSFTPVPGFSSELDSKSSYALQIWDSSIKMDNLDSFFDGTHCIIVCYAINDPSGLKAAEPFMQTAKQYAAKCSSRLFLLGCKSDSSCHHVSYEAAQSFAQSNNALFLGECSSRTNSSVDAIFCVIAQRAFEKKC